MAVGLTLLLLMSPFVVAAALGWAAHRSGSLRLSREQFQVASPMRVFENDSDARRLEHELDAIRTRFEHRPCRPGSGALGERR